MYKHLLVAIDGSHLSAAAVQEAIQFAKAIGARITFFNALENFYATTLVGADGLTIDPTVAISLAKANKLFSTSILEKAKDLAQQAGVVAETEISVNILVYEGIIDAAQSHGCDLIFMASHGRKGLSALMIGSETQRVLNHSTIPVLVFRGEPSNKA